MLSLVMLGRRPQADRRAGDGLGTGGTVGRSPRGLDQLARAAWGIRTARVDKAKTRVLRAKWQRTKGGMVGLRATKALSCAERKATIVVGTLHARA